MSSSQPLHTNCQFTGQRVCRCVYGNAAILASRSEAEPAPDAAEAYMRRARAAWRLLHHPDSPALRDNGPVVLWLPRLEKRAAQPAASAAVAAAAAQVRRAEAAARAAVVHAAGLAAAAGLPFRLPDQLQAQLGGVPLDMGGLVQADYSELERQVQALQREQEAQQAAAAGAAGGAALATPTVAPLPAALAATSSDGLLPPAGSGRLVQRSRSLDAGLGGSEAPQLAGPHSMPLPSRTASGSAGARARRSPASKPPAGPSSRAGRAGPGTGSRGSRGACRASPGEAQQGDAAGVGPPSLAPFGPGYEPRGPSSAPPPRGWLLTMRDFTPALQGRLIQTFWPDGGRWWPAVVLAVSLPARTCTLHYETGDQESVHFPPLVHAGEMAWLHSPPAPAAAGASGGSHGRAGSAPPQSGGRPPLSAGLCSPSQQSLHSTGQQQEQQQRRQQPGQEGLPLERQRSGTAPAEAAGQAAGATADSAPGQADSLPGAPASGRTSPADRSLASPSQSAEAGPHGGSAAGPPASGDGAAKLLPAAGRLSGAASSGCDLWLGTAEPPDPPPPVSAEQQEEQGEGHGRSVAEAADEECAAPAAPAEQQAEQEQPDGLPDQRDTPPAADQQECEPKQQHDRQAKPAHQPQEDDHQPAQHAGVAAPGSLAGQEEGAPQTVDEQQAEQLAAGPSDEQQAGAAPATSSGVEAQPDASRAERDEQAPAAQATEQPEVGATPQQEQLQPQQRQGDLPSAAEEPSPEQQPQAPPSGEARGALAQPQDKSAA